MGKKTRQLEKENRSVYWGFRMNIMIIPLRGLGVIVFLLLGEYIMAGVCLAGLLSYIYVRRIIGSSPDKAYYFVCIEVFIHMMAGIFLMGWDCCFQNLAFATIPICFFSDYALKRDGGEGFHSTAIAILYIAAYIGARVFFTVVKPEYRQPVLVDDLIAFVNSAIALLMLLGFSYVYTHRTMETEKQLESIAAVDKLTGLYNRHMIPSAQQQFKIGTADTDKVYSVAILDIDNFKRVNDTYGHLAGDQVLIRLADNLRKSDVDFVCRWGGEEFMIVAAGEDSKERLLKAAEKVRAMMSISAAAFEGTFIRVTVSVGLAESDGEENFQETVERADKALYYAKTHGKNRVIVSGIDDCA